MVYSQMDSPGFIILIQRYVARSVQVTIFLIIIVVLMRICTNSDPNYNSLLQLWQLPIHLLATVLYYSINVFFIKKRHENIIFTRLWIFGRDLWSPPSAPSPKEKRNKINSKHRPCTSFSINQTDAMHADWRSKIYLCGPWFFHLQHFRWDVLTEIPRRKSTSYKWSLFYFSRLSPTYIA